MSGRAKGFALLGVVFLLGAAAGGGGVFAMVERQHAAIARGDAGALENKRLKSLTKKLDLDDAQRAQIQAVLTRDKDDSKALSREMMERCGQPLRDHKKEVDAEIRAVLRPEQQAKFDAMVDERKRHAVVR